MQLNSVYSVSTVALYCVIVVFLTKFAIALGILKS